MLLDDMSVDITAVVEKAFEYKDEHEDHVYKCGKACNGEKRKLHVKCLQTRSSLKKINKYDMFLVLGFV